MNNIDLICAESGTEMAGDGKIDQSLINNSLAVLLEQGIYSLFLFLCSRGSALEKPAEHIRKKIVDLLNKDFLNFKIDNSKLKKELLELVRTALSTSEANIYLAKDALEKSLVYARYHSKTK